MKGTRMVKTIQTIVKKQVNDSEFQVGTVISTSPLKVRVGSKKILTKDFLFLSPLCKQTEMKIGSSQYTLWRGLKTGDKILMISSSHGQFYYVMQRKEGIL